MIELSKCKYGVQCYQASAGQFSLNCAYFGIPCIGNEKMDTQRNCHPDLSVDVDDVETARILARRLKEDKEFYKNIILLFGIVSYSEVSSGCGRKANLLTRREWLIFDESNQIICSYCGKIYKKNIEEEV